MLIGNHAAGTPPSLCDLVPERRRHACGPSLVGRQGAGRGAALEARIGHALAQGPGLGLQLSDEFVECACDRRLVQWVIGEQLQDSPPAGNGLVRDRSQGHMRAFAP